MGLRLQALKEKIEELEKELKYQKKMFNHEIIRLQNEITELKIKIGLKK